MRGVAVDAVALRPEVARDGARERFEEEDRLVGEGAAGVEPVHRPLAGRQRRAGLRDPTMDGGAVPREGPGRPRLAPQRGERRRRGVLERGDPSDLALARADAVLGAEQGEHGGLAETAELVLDLALDLRPGRLADHHHELRGRIGAERVEGVEGHGPADRAAHIAPAHADGLRDALAAGSEKTGDLLEAGARGGHEADPPSRHDVGEAERRAAQVGSAAVRAHEQQALVSC